MNESLQMQDKEYAEFVLEKAEVGDEHVTLTFDDGMVTGYGREDSLAPEFVPKAGQTVRFYGKNAGMLGGSRRGLVIGGRVIEYRTEEEDWTHRRMQALKGDVERQREFSKNESLLEEKLDALPIPFRTRIHHYLHHNPNFYWQYLAYELAVCQDAARLAGVASAKCVGSESAVGWIENFAGLEYEQQIEIAPWMSGDHSGNSFGCVIRLASVDASGGMVELEHGVMCPLVGCGAYGCRLADQ